MKPFRWLIVIFLFFACFFVTTEAYAYEEIKVLLTSSQNHVEFAATQGEYQLFDKGSGLPLAEIKPWEIWTIFKEGQKLKLQKKGDSKIIDVIGSVIMRAKPGKEMALVRFRGVQYRGDLIFSSGSAGIQVVNSLGLEEYLYGVLPKELSPSLPKEALKAQAVACRTLAIYNKGSSTGYDVIANTSTQVYGGYDAEDNAYQDRVKKAVDETAGEILLYDNNVINAVFHSNAGGKTVSSRSLWGGERPYLQSVASPFDYYALEYANDPLSWPANTYEWSKTFTKTELSQAINNWNRNRPAEQIRVGTVLSINLIKDDNKDPLSRVKEIEIMGTTGKAVISGEKSRQVFNLRSTLFDLIGDSSLWLLSSTQKQAKSTPDPQFVVLGATSRGFFQEGEAKKILTKSGMEEINTGSSDFTFVGKGYGHGVGMSQWGAVGMAAAGYRYQEILEYYYNQDKYDGRLTIERLY